MSGALWCPYLILMGIFQRFDFLFMFVVLGVESINYLETGREWDDRMRIKERKLLLTDSISDQ